MSEPLWIEQPTILFDREHVKKFVWTSDMDYNQRLNATVRFIIYFSVLAFLYFNRVEWLYLALAIIGYLFYAHYRRPQLVQQFLYLDDIHDHHPNEATQATPTLATPASTPTHINQTGGSRMEQVGGGSLEQREWEENYGPNAPFRGYSHDLIDPNVVIEPSSNQRCKVSTPNNPFGNALPGDNEILRATPLCDPDAQKDAIDANFQKGLFSDLNDVFQRNNSQRQYITQPSTTIPNDREGFMTWLWETPFVCKDGDMDVCFKQGY